MSSSLSRKPRTLKEVLAERARPPVVSLSNPRNFRWYEQSVRDLEGLIWSLQRIAQQQYGLELQAPATPLVDAVLAAKLHGTLDALKARLGEFIDALCGALQGYKYFGECEYLGEHECRFRYFDGVRRVGPISITHTIRSHEHYLVGDQECFLGEVELPPKQERIAGMIPESWQEEVRIITGTLVQMEEAAAGVEKEEHAVGRTLRRYGQIVPATAAGVVAGGALGILLGAGGMAASAALATALAAATVVAVADPAIVIGDLVLTGWIGETNE